MWYTIGKLVFWGFWKHVIQYVFVFVNFCQFMRGGWKKNQNFKIVIKSSVIHHWKAGVLRFLKTYYTISWRFCNFFPILKIKISKSSLNQVRYTIVKLMFWGFWKHVIQYVCVFAHFFSQINLVGKPVADCEPYVLVFTFNLRICMRV